MRQVWAAAFLLRRLRTEPGVTLMLFALVAVTAFLFAAAPRLLERVSDDALQHELGSASAVHRNVQVTLLGNFPASRSGDALDGVRRTGNDFRGRMPESLSSLVERQALVVTSVRFKVADPPVYNDTFVTLRHQDGLKGVIDLVAGRPPRALGQPLPEARYGFAPPDPEPPAEPPAEPPLVEIALSDATAQATGLALGDVLDVSADFGDPRLPRQLASSLDARFAVVGIFTVLDRNAEIWYEDSSLQVLNVGGTDDNPLAFATAMVAPEAYADLAPSGLPFTYEWRYFVDPARLDSSGVEPLLVDLRGVETRFLSGPTFSRREPSASTGLPALLEGYLARRSASQAVLSVAAIGPLVLAAGAVGMVGVLLVTRRRAALALARGRGASWLLLLGAQLWEALLVVGAGVVAGFTAAALAIPGRDNPASVWLALAVGAAAVVTLLAATWPVVRRPLRDLEAEQHPGLRPSPRRLVLEGTVVALCLAGVLLMQQRGLTLDGGRTTRFDPFLAATPALAGLAAGIVAMRLYPFPIRALGWLAARRRDLVPVLGLRSVGRHPTAANLPLLVLLLAAAFGAFTSVVGTTVDRGQVAASWQNLGADYRIDRVGGGPLAPAIDPDELEGTQGAAGAFVDRQARFTSTPNQRASIVLYAIDTDAYPAIVAGSPIELSFPSAFGAEAAAADGTPERPIPAILSRRLPPASAVLGPGDTFEVDVAGQPMTFRVVAQRTTPFPGLPDATTFVVAPLPALQRSYVNQTLQPTALLLRGPSGLAGDLLATARDRVPSARVTSRHAAYAALREAPLISAVSAGFTAALAIAAGYTALAVVAALTLSAAQRTRDLAFLRTLGVSTRQSLQLIVVEHGPPVLIALLPGAALGVAIAHLLEPSLGLSAFAATGRPLAIETDWAGLAAVSLGLLGVVALAIGISTWLSRRARPTDALRMGED